MPDRRLIESLTLTYSDAVVDSLEDLTDSFLITDPSISGHSVVFASRGFLAITGYSREEVVGRNARIFQGPATDRRSVMEVREAIMGERTVQISLLNYRKDGTPYWILFHLSPVFFDHDSLHSPFLGCTGVNRRQEEVLSWKDCWVSSFVSRRGQG